MLGEEFEELGELSVGIPRADEVQDKGENEKCGEACEDKGEVAGRQVGI